MRRVAGRRVQRVITATSELPFIRVYAPDTVGLGDEVMAHWRATVGELTGRTWCLARENDLFVRLYLLPERRHGG